MAWDVVNNWVAEGDVPAVAAAIVGRSGVEHAHVAGAAEADSLFALASLTKPIVAIAALVAAEEGTIELDAAVGDHLPAYRDPARAGITARHLLAHASGLPETAKGVAPLEVQPVRPPASRRIYSNEGYHVLAALIEAASGIDYRRYVTEAVLRPLDMDAFLPLPEEEYGRALEVLEPGLVAPGVQLFNGREWRRRGSAAGGCFATAEAYARVVQLLLAGGAPLLSAESGRDLASTQWPGLEGGLESYPKLHCPDWGLGLNLRGTGDPHWCGDAVSPATLSHFGASGTLMWADPAAARGLVCLANRSTYSGWMMRPGRWADLTAQVLTT